MKCTAVVSTIKPLRHRTSWVSSTPYYIHPTISTRAGFISFGLVYWGLTPQQQPGSYQGGEMMMMKSVFWWRKPEYPGNHRPTASNWWNFSHIRPLSSPGIELGPQWCEAKSAKAWWERRLSSPSYRSPWFHIMSCFTVEENKTKFLK